MAIENFTSYLGKEVVFLNPVNYFGLGLGIYELVRGVVDGVVLLHPDISETEFFVLDETYRFSEVIFVLEQDNPINHH